ncbi:hypothetical protein F511_01706 [Dorcoceras hygrometricum]|nr:hypothetical protein F511_01706 [Dorcoceras hygrometricum]
MLRLDDQLVVVMLTKVQRFVSGSSDLMILRLPFFLCKKVPLEDFDKYRRCRLPVTEPRSK